MPRHLNGGSANLGPSKGTTLSFAAPAFAGCSDVGQRVRPDTGVVKQMVRCHPIIRPSSSVRYVIRTAHEGGPIPCYRFLRAAQDRLSGPACIATIVLLTENSGCHPWQTSLPTEAECPRSSGPRQLESPALLGRAGGHARNDHHQGPAQPGVVPSGSAPLRLENPIGFRASRRPRRAPP